jgi:hypothetical protein
LFDRHKIGNNGTNGTGGINGGGGNGSGGNGGGGNGGGGGGGGGGNGGGGNGGGNGGSGGFGNDRSPFSPHPPDPVRYRRGGGNKSDFKILIMISQNELLSSLVGYLSDLKTPNDVINIKHGNFSKRQLLGLDATPTSRMNLYSAIFFDLEEVGVALHDMGYLGERVLFTPNSIVLENTPTPKRRSYTHVMPIPCALFVLRQFIAQSKKAKEASVGMKELSELPLPERLIERNNGARSRYISYLGGSCMALLALVHARLTAHPMIGKHAYMHNILWHIDKYHPITLIISTTLTLTTYLHVIILSSIIYIINISYYPIIL